MTTARLQPDEIKEVQQKARLDAQAFLSGWPVKGNPYYRADKATLYCAEYAAAIKEGKK